MYVQDWDEGLVLDTHSGPTSTWIETLQPYTRNRLLNRCPSDCSRNFERPLAGQSQVRRTSYGTNGYLTPSGGFMALCQILSPSRTIYVCELMKDKTGDHVHPTAWALPNRWNKQIDPRTEVDTLRHHQGANYVYVDSHVKWHRFEQTFAPPTVNFWDPSR
jgi:prepilin-type processing-associated H-X9-DG protein